MFDFKQKPSSLFGSRITGVRAKKLNLDYECYSDFLSGKGIRLTSVESFDKKNDKIWNGLQSEFFGTDFGDNKAFEERYSCKCKKYVGKMYMHQVCEICGASVEYSDADLTKFGWIILDRFKVISPIYYAKLGDALGSSSGEKVIDKILQVKFPDENTNLVELSERDQLEMKKHPFCFKGMVWFQDNILEVLNYYEKRKPMKSKIFKELKEDLPNIFTSSIPVYSSILRTELPGATGQKLYKLKINTIYQAIIRITNFINNIDEFTEENILTINKQLHSIQEEMGDIFTLMYSEISGKEGLIISKVLGKILPVSPLTAGKS